MTLIHVALASAYSDVDEQAMQAIVVKVIPDDPATPLQLFPHLFELPTDCQEAARLNLVTTGLVLACRAINSGLDEVAGPPPGPFEVRLSMKGIFALMKSRGPHLATTREALANTIESFTSIGVPLELREPDVAEEADVRAAALVRAPAAIDAP